MANRFSNVTVFSIKKGTVKVKLVRLLTTLTVFSIIMKRILIFNENTVTLYLYIAFINVGTS